MQSEFPVQCERLYGERLQELRKYVLEMFLNLERNEVLKELHGSVQLDELRARKIEEIVRDALEGEKERQIQLLVERISQLSLQLGKLQAQQSLPPSISLQQREIDRIREECQEKLEEQEVRHCKDTNFLEKHFRELLRSALSNYERHLTRQLCECCHTNPPNTDHEIAALLTRLQEKDQIIEELAVRLDDMRASNELQAQRLLGLECENKCLLDNIAQRTKKSLELDDTIRKQKPRRMVTFQPPEKPMMTDTEGPAEVVKRQLEEYKLRERLECKLHQQRKSYSEQVAKLRGRTKRSPNNMINPREGISSKRNCCEDSFTTIQKSFERDLLQLKKTLDGNGTVLKTVQFAE